MGKCIKCGVKFVGTPENPQPDGLCRRCEIIQLKTYNAKLQIQRDQALHLLQGGKLTKNQAVDSGLGEGVLIEQRHFVRRAIRLARLWRKEARNNLAAARICKTCQNAAFERGLALGKQQCSEQLRRAAE